MDNSEFEKTFLGEQYRMPQAEKEAALGREILRNAARAASLLPPLVKFYSEWGFDPAAQTATLESIPPLPVSAFKNADLRVCTPGEVVRTVKSSGTSGLQSRIYVDRATSERQQKALAAVFKSMLGKARRPYLAIDARVSNAAGGEITARTAGLRGFMQYADGMAYALEEEGGALEPAVSSITDFLAENSGREIMMFGFTYIVWSQFLGKLAGRTFDADSFVLLHSGGWKKMEAEKAGKAEFEQAFRSAFPGARARFVEFYGMAEQVGMIFPDCEKGFKHAPDFGDVIVRSPADLRACQTGESGLIELVSALPLSYPGSALLTEDVGRIVGVDDCGCGRKGKYFAFEGRAARSEPRGCGDTFRQGATS